MVPIEPYNLPSALALREIETLASFNSSARSLANACVAWCCFSSSALLASNFVIFSAVAETAFPDGIK